MRNRVLGFRRKENEEDMKRHGHLFTFIIIIGILLQACGGDSQSDIATAVAQTQQISQLETAAAPAEETRAEKEAKVHEQQGENLYFQHSYEGALTQFNLAIELDPQFALAYSFRSQTKHNLSINLTSFFADTQDRDDLVTAIALLQGALFDHNTAYAFDPQYADAYFYEGSVYYDLGIINEDLGNMQAAIDNYSFFLGLYPYEDALSDYARQQLDALNVEE